jgi:hypothetical protein
LEILKLKTKRMAIYSDQEDPNHIMWNKENEKENEISIAVEKTPSFVETWYEGVIEYQGKKHQFWIIDPEGSEYEIECRWFFKNVPREVRMMYNSIIESYKQIKYDRRKEEN